LELPVCIVRPAIVTTSHQEPFPGWIDNFTGFSGVVAGFARGIVRVGSTNKTQTLEIVPVDHVVNLTLAAAASLGSSPTDSNDVRVYNCTSCEHPFGAPELKDVMMEAVERTPFDEIYWYPSVTFVNSSIARDALSFLLHYIPALLVDGILAITGKKRKYSVVKTYKKMKTLFDLTTQIVAMDVSFSVENTKNLYRGLAPIEQERFNFDITTVNKREYIFNGLYGLRRYAAGEMDDDLPKARQNFQRYKKIYYVSWVLLVLVGSLAVRFVSALLL
jgi:fatty acyl-CoA reductase